MNDGPTPADLREAILALFRLWEQQIGDSMKDATKDDLPRLRDELAHIRSARVLINGRPKSIRG